MKTQKSTAIFGICAVLALLGLVFMGCPEPPDNNPNHPPVYIITGSGTAFTATRGGETRGEANTPIQDVIDAIRTHANGDDCTIQFGDGETTLDIGEAYISFTTANDETWGHITLQGKITSAMTNTITVEDDVSLTSMADIANTSTTSGRTIIHNSTGTVTVSGGTVSTSSITAIYSTGTIMLSGSPTITNRIYIANNGTLGVDSSFNPGSKKYSLYLYPTTYTHGMVAVVGGKDF